MIRSIAVATALVVLPIAASVAANSFDGTYTGPGSMVRGAPPTCPAPSGNSSWTVTDGRVSHSYANAPLNAQVTADGSFKATAQYMAGRSPNIAKMEGRISGNTMQVDIEGGYCQYHWSLKKG